MSKATSDWDRIGDRFYRKVQLYSPVFDADIELENYLISGAPYSGALALYRNDDKVYAYRGSEPSRSSIDLYSCSGKLIRRINWDKGPIRGLGWSEDEKLLVISQDGTVRCYSNLSDDFTAFSLGHGSEEHGIVSCRFWLSGFVALFGNNSLVTVTNYNEPRPKLLATPPSDSIVSWNLIPPAYTLSRSVEVLLAMGQTINVVDTTDSEDRMLQNGPFRQICVSPNGKFIALYTDDGKVWVISSDFQDKLSEYDSRVKTSPKDMQWCGNDSVVLAWDDEIHMVGPSGAAAKYYFDAWVHLVPDIDGIRLFTNESCEFLQKVPDVVEETFKLGSTSPSAVLLDAVDQLEKKSPKADDNIQMIKPNLVDAVDDCIKAAGYEFSIHWQKQLLKAASFGKTVLDFYDSDDFVEMCETVRVLNAVRFHEVGIPLSYDQYERLNPERLVQRLVYRQEYLLALRLSEALRLPTNRIYVHWASQKVRVSTGDEDTICQNIVDKLQGKSGVSFEEIARAAHDEGRQRLATLLLNHEPRAGKQVPLLLNMEEDIIALDKAIESGDTDLILFVLLHLKNKLPLASFFRTINSRPVATALVESTAMDQDRQLLKDLYYQDDRRLDGSNLLFLHALAQQDTQAKLDKLRPAAKLLQDGRDTAFQARAIDELQRLLRFQEALDADPQLGASGTSTAATNTSNTAADDLSTAPTIAPSSGSDPPKFTGLSLNATLYHLFRLLLPKRAAKLATDFKIPDRTLWQVRLRALAAARAWRDLEEIAKVNRRSPIGWEPFVEACLAAGNARLAGNVFVGKCVNLTYKERAELYAKCGMLGKAGEEAVKAKDGGLLEEIRGKAAGGREEGEIERLFKVLGRGK